VIHLGDGRWWDEDAEVRRFGAMAAAGAGEARQARSRRRGIARQQGGLAAAHLDPTPAIIDRAICERFADAATYCTAVKIARPQQVHATPLSHYASLKNIALQSQILADSRLLCGADHPNLLVG
jgi:hypothetical protein